MIVVIDTNVVISAALRDRDPEIVIAWVLERPDWSWVATVEIVAEYHDVLSRPRLGLPEGNRARWVEIVRRGVDIIEAPAGRFDRDPADAKFLACVAAGNADYLITGDSDLLSVPRQPKTHIISPAAFKRAVCDARSEDPGRTTDSRPE